MFVGPVATAAWRNPKTRPDRITDCIRSIPDSRPRPTMCDRSARPHGTSLGVTDGARTRDLRSRTLRPGIHGRSPRQRLLSTLPPSFITPPLVCRLVCATLSPFCEGGDELAVEVGDVGHDATPDRPRGQWSKNSRIRLRRPPEALLSDFTLAAGVLTGVPRGGEAEDEA
jgi:hypothetical protein